MRAQMQAVYEASPREPLPPLQACAEFTSACPRASLQAVSGPAALPTPK